jgi:hypothetical protein
LHMPITRPWIKKGSAFYGIVPHQATGKVEKQSFQGFPGQISLERSNQNSIEFFFPHIRHEIHS